MTEAVNHPLHYNSSQASCPCGQPIECLSVVRHMSFNLGNVIKYVWRHEHKGGIEDLKKALFYLQDEINKLSHPPSSSLHTQYLDVRFNNPE